MMSISQEHPVGEAPRSVHAKSLRKRIVTVVGTFFVAAAFGLAGAPAATAATGDCNGHYPGCCFLSPR